MTHGDLSTLVEFNYWARDRMLESVSALECRPICEADGEQLLFGAGHGRPHLLSRVGLVFPLARHVPIAHGSMRATIPTWRP